MLVVKDIIIELPLVLIEAEPSNARFAVTKFAVMMPVPLMVAVVDADDGLAIVIDPVALQDENA